MQRIVLDTDLSMGEPGSEIDDGFALALAVADQELSVELVTTVHGNTDVDTATALTVELLDRIGRPDIPVVRGADRPLHRAVWDPATDQRAARSRQRPSAARAAPGVAAVEIVAAAAQAPGELVVVAIGPLTNLALAFRLEPRTAERLAGIVVMGGVFSGTTNQLDMPGEFNCWVDPDAVAAVIEATASAGTPLRFVGLDVTRRVRLDRADVASLAGAGGSFAPFAAACAGAWIDAVTASGTEPGSPDSCALHDPLAVAAVSRPDLFTWAPAAVAVETVGEVARGVTVADFRPTVATPTCQVATDVDVAAFRRMVLEELGSR